MKSNQLSEPQIIQKLESFCAYRERCESEVRQKLYQLAVEDSDTDFYLNYLKENNFLNEERFVSAFARGKFNIKSWGKRKIMQELQSKRIDSKKIQQSINAIAFCVGISCVNSLRININTCHSACTKARCGNR